jgi:hypothetical protein
MSYSVTGFSDLLLAVADCQHDAGGHITGGACRSTESVLISLSMPHVGHPSHFPVEFRLPLTAMAIVEAHRRRSDSRRPKLLAVRPQPNWVIRDALRLSPKARDRFLLAPAAAASLPTATLAFRAWPHVASHSASFPVQTDHTTVFHSCSRCSRASSCSARAPESPASRRQPSSRAAARRRCCSGELRPREHHLQARRLSLMPPGPSPP